MLVDLVKIIANSTGSGAIVFGAAATGYRGVEALSNGDSYGYSISQGENYEYGYGTYLSSGNQFIRSPLGSSNGGEPLELAPGAEVAFVALSKDYAFGAGSDAVAEVLAAAAIVVPARNEAVAAANAASLSASNAAASEDAAELSAQAALTAQLYSKAYPNAAATNVPRGLTQAGVGAITGGSGGANGTFALAWTGGNFVANPVGTFTVAGNVLTAVTISEPGRYIGGSPTVPTPVFTASAGLTGASVVLTSQLLILSGEGYFVQSADGYSILNYMNNSGTPALVSVGPFPTLAYVDAAPVTNRNPDPFFQQMGLYDGGGPVRSYNGTLNIDDADSAASGFYGNSLSEVGNGLVRRYVLLSDLGLVPGDSVSVAMKGIVTAAYTAGFSFATAAMADIPSYGEYGAVSSSFDLHYKGTVPPSGSAPVFLYYLIQGSGGGTKKMLAAAIGKGPRKPSYMPPLTPALQLTPPQNQFLDSLNMLASNNGRRLGKFPHIPAVDGYPLLGELFVDPGGTGLSLIAAPSQSPFQTPAINIPVGGNLHVHYCPATRLNLREGQWLYVVAGYVARQIITAAIRFEDATGTALAGTTVSLSRDMRDATNAAGYREIVFRIRITAAIAKNAFRLRYRMEDTIITEAAKLVGISIANQPHTLKDTMGPERSAELVARSSSPMQMTGNKIMMATDSILGTAIKTQTDPDTYAYMVLSERLEAIVKDTGIGGTLLSWRLGDANWNALGGHAIASYIDANDFTPMTAAAAAIGDASIIQKVAVWASTPLADISRILVNYLVNDRGLNTPLGVITDTTPLVGGVPSFYGAVNHMIDKIQSRCPWIALDFVTAKYVDRLALNGYGVAEINGTVMTVTNAITASYSVGDTIYAEGINSRVKIIPGGSGTGGNGTYFLDSNLGVISSRVISSADAVQNGNTPNGVGVTLPQYNAALRTACEAKGLKVVRGDLCGINANNINRFSQDGYHLSQSYGFDKFVDYTTVQEGQQ